MSIDLPGISFRLVGESPLLMHNERLANPLDPATKRLKALTGKRKKTDEDIALISRAEFDGGLYINGAGPYIPDTWVLALLRDGGKLLKLGRAVTQGVLIFEAAFPLEIPLGKNVTADRLWDEGYFDQRMVGNQQNRVLRTRPRFDEWAVSCSVSYDPAVLDERQLRQILDLAGLRIGLGDFRPRFGRFRVE